MTGIAAVKQARGETTNGKAGFGWALDGKLLVPHPTEALVAGELWYLRWNTGASWETMAKHANALGSVTRTGLPWTRERLYSAVGKYSTEEQREALHEYWITNKERPRALLDS